MYGKSENDLPQKSDGVAFLERSSPFEETLEGASVAVLHDDDFADGVGVGLVYFDDESTFAFPHVGFLCLEVGPGLRQKLLALDVLLHFLEVDHFEGHVLLGLGVDCLKHSGEGPLPQLLCYLVFAKVDVILVAVGD